jgi:hypothetical protein
MRHLRQTGLHIPRLQRRVMNNQSSLDSLVQAHLSRLSAPSSPLQEAIAAVSAAAREGDVQAAATLAAPFAPPGVLDEPRFQLDLRIHALLERVHGSKTGLTGHADALAYARDSLAPYAQEAFPEAYAVFVQAMLVFAYPQSVADMRPRREALAAKMISTMWAHAPPDDSPLEALLRYLAACMYLGAGARFAPDPSRNPAADTAIRRLFPPPTSEPPSPLTSKAPLPLSAVPQLALLPWAADPRPLPHASENRDYTDLELLALRDRLPHMTFLESLDSMRYASGNVENALRAELARIRINRPELDAIVADYCVSRGLDYIDPGGSSSAKPPPKSAVSECRLDLYSTMRRLRELTASGSTTRLVEAAKELDPGLLESSPTLTFRIGQAALVHELRAGKMTSALAIARTRLGPLADAHPHLHPALKETTTLLSCSGAVDLASSPRAATDGGKPGSEAPKMEETVSGDTDGGSTDSEEDRTLAILQAVVESSSAKALAGQIYSAVGRRLGKDGPDGGLVGILQAALETHANWVAASGVDDIFSEPLGIDELWRREDVEGEGGDGGCEDDVEAERGAGGGANGPKDAGRDVMITTLMEVLAVPRSEAREIVAGHAHLNDAQSILEALLGV